jgi:hypothetical protein
MNGCWVLYQDHAVVAYSTEIDALREAVETSATVRFVPFGTSFIEALNSEQRYTPDDWDEPIPYQLDTPTPVDGKTPEELILDRITLPENHGMGPA